MTIYISREQLEDYTTTLASVPIEQLNPPYKPYQPSTSTPPQQSTSNKEIYIAAAALFVLVLFSVNK